MHVIRGRIGQYKILMQQEQLSPYVVVTERFSKATLFSMLKSTNKIILKPITGMDSIFVEKQQGKFRVRTNLETIEGLEGTRLYESIQQVIGDRNYVMQPQLNSTHLTKKSFRRFITVHKRNGHWYVTASSKQTSNVIEALAYFMHQARLKKLALMAAEQLGPFYPLCESIVIELSFTLAGDVAITDSFLHFSVSKWNQYQSIAKYMPQTDLLTRATFTHYLKKYPLVFLKPCNGQQGKGIIKISKMNRRSYEIQIGRQKWMIQGIGQVSEHIRKHVAIENNYIIQRGIALATINQRFSDIRVMTQKAKNDWHVTGKVVKVAGPHFFVTNAVEAVLPLPIALKQSTVLSLFHRRLDKRMDRMCIAASKLLDEPAERKIIGFDVAVTNFGQIRILEGNYVPDLSLFKNLEEPAMYNTVLEYIRMNR
ncbi:MAG: YheC/YheD family protein [Solibacillus sp.]